MIVGSAHACSARMLDERPRQLDAYILESMYRWLFFVNLIFESVPFESVAPEYAWFKTSIWSSNVASVGLPTKKQPRIWKCVNSMPQYDAFDAAMRGLKKHIAHSNTNIQHNDPQITFAGVMDAMEYNLNVQGSILSRLSSISATSAYKLGHSKHSQLRPWIQQKTWTTKPPLLEQG
jgi:hypothetical protein